VKRIRWIAAAFVVPLTTCADDTPSLVTTVAIAATPCDRPTARLGVGTVVAPGLVLTAAHVVEDDLRDVEIDGRPARVEALDARVDAAVLAVDPPTDDGVAMRSDVDVADAVRIITPTDVIDTSITRVVTLSVDDATDGVIHRRRALVLDGAVPAGTSGAPVVDDDGRIVGMVTISHTGRDVTYATRTGELRPLIDAASASGYESVTRSSLAAQTPCA
jgi:S1-C subfamily serine protease